jgi:hypothetical protein
MVMADQVAIQILGDGAGLDALCCSANGRILREGNDTGLRVNAFGEIRADVLGPVLATTRGGFLFNREGEWLGRLESLPVSGK